MMEDELNSKVYCTRLCVSLIVLLIQNMSIYNSNALDVFSHPSSLLWSAKAHIHRLVKKILSQKVYLGRSVRSCSHTIPEKVRNSRSINIGFKGWG